MVPLTSSYLRPLPRYQSIVQEGEAAAGGGLATPSGATAASSNSAATAAAAAETAAAADIRLLREALHAAEEVTFPVARYIGSLLAYLG